MIKDLFDQEPASVKEAVQVWRDSDANSNLNGTVADPELQDLDATERERVKKAMAYQK